MPNDSKSILFSHAPAGGVPRSFLSSLSLRKLFGGWSLVLMAIGTLWAFFFNAIRSEWSINPQYGYGYVVPIMAVVLLWRRWADRPPAAAANRTVVGTIAAALMFLLLPLVMALEANPEWRLLYWIAGVQTIGLSLSLIYGTGGTQWVRHFSPPLLFALVAIPWPTGMEQAIIQNLTRLVAALTVEIAGIISIPAMQHGNLIEVGTGVVGIDEACSGIRSFQSALMLSLFIGEAQRFSRPRRLGLLGASLVFVIVANLCRTTFLVWAAAQRGLQQMEAWHDSAGNLVMLIVLPGLLGLGYLLRPKAGPPRESPIRSAEIPILMPRWIGTLALLWIAAALVFSEAWYRIHESGLISNPRWSVAWPITDSQFKKTAVPARSLAILRCSNSDAATWEDAEGNDWSGFFLRWNPGKNSAQLARGHRPDICFPASGARLVNDFGQVTLRAGDLQLPFKYQTFENNGVISHVFYCLWADRRSTSEKPLVEDGSEASRLQAILAGKRHLGQQVFELVIRGPRSREEAMLQMERTLPTLIQPDQAK